MNSSIAQRANGFLGTLITLVAVALGALGPSWLTLVAIASLPALVVFPWYTISPSSFEHRVKVKRYLVMTSILALGSVAFETWWLFDHGVKITPKEERGL
jgi:hypothetical protein